jgi:NAD(P)-dependent dehydrogenase (short-subunit alcohol dehydrogenase family)
MAEAGKINLSEQVAIVTGAAGGLGRAYALALAERGAAVVVKAGWRAESLHVRKGNAPQRRRSSRSNNGRICLQSL